MARKIGGKVLRGLHHFATLGEALDIVKDRHQVDVSKGEAGAYEIAGPGNGLVQYIDLLLHRRQRAVDRGAVGLAVDSLRNQIAEEIRPYQTGIDSGVDERDPLLDFGSSARIFGDQFRAGESLVDVSGDGL